MFQDRLLQILVSHTINDKFLTCYPFLGHLCFSSDNSESHLVPRCHRISKFED